MSRGFGRGFKPLLRILKNVDVVRKARPFTVDGDTSRYVAVKATLCRKHAQHMGL